MGFVKGVVRELMGEVLQPAIERWEQGIDQLCEDIEKVADATIARFRKVESRVQSNTAANRALAARIEALEREVEGFREEFRDLWSRRHEP